MYLGLVKQIKYTLCLEHVQNRIAYAIQVFVPIQITSVSHLQFRMHSL